jgi:hypothetical protein
MDFEEIQARVDAIRPWHYEFDLGGVRTPIYRPDLGTTLGVALAEKFARRTLKRGRRLVKR